jgi:hypothetical protein
MKVRRGGSVRCGVKLVLAVAVALVGLGVQAPAGDAASAPPTITQVTGVKMSVDPAGGSLNGGTPIVITGTHFTASSQIGIYGSGTGEIEYAYNVVVVSQTSITAKAPSWNYVGSAGQLLLSVCTRAGCSNAAPFTVYAPEIGELLAYNGVDDDTEACTATVVSSAQNPSKDIILSAGHCTWSEDHKIAYGPIAFAPGFFGKLCPSNGVTDPKELFKCGTAPLGVWSVFDVERSSDYETYGYKASDVSFSAVSNNASGHSIGSVVGTYPVVFCSGDGGCNPAGGATWDWDAFGEQPGATGVPISLRSCLWYYGQSNITVYSVNGSKVLRVYPCSSDILTVGASGGPWVRVTSLQIGAVNIITLNDSMLGAYLGKEARDLYNRAVLAPVLISPPGIESYDFAAGWARAQQAGPQAPPPPP